MPSFHTIQAQSTPDDPRGLIESNLGSGERILWQGQPDVWAFSMRGAWYLIPFSILWAGFAIFWEIGVLNEGAGPLFALWGIPFVLIGIYMVFGRIPLARWEARRTLFSVTSKRVIIVSGGLRSRWMEVALRDLPPAELDDGGSGLGTITFGSYAGAYRPPPGWPTFGMYGTPPAFTSIHDPARVYRVIQDAKEAARAG